MTTDTPRTDAFCIALQATDFDSENWEQVIKIAGFARELERELAEAREWLDERYKATSEADERAEKAEAELAELWSRFDKQMEAEAEVERLNSLCKSGEMSDGIHSFNALYDHRCTLFLALMKAHPSISWVSSKHHDGEEWDGWFIAGINTAAGDVTYHLPVKMWSLACETGAAILELGRLWDGHTSEEVIDRLTIWIKLKTPDKVNDNNDSINTPNT